ncbi:helix-turn-helix domain-containing protein [Pedobacter sp. AW1-32]|uniref:helix-turn-helix domain-containing protein n=1 Tax=Pedobacter sp. AW1-32 TaxID=3383026 RepID=UPI003FF15441
MPTKRTSIPVNYFGGEDNFSISVERISFHSLPDVDLAKQMHRHDRHTFFLLEEGAVQMEIDFEEYVIEQFSVLYVHADQVHRTLSTNKIVVSSWAIGDEHLNPEYRDLLKDMGNVKPIVLDPETFSLLRDAISLCLKITESKSEKLFRTTLKDSCNTLVGLTISQYLKCTALSGSSNRFDQVTKAFRALVDEKFVSNKRPVEYAELLNISTSYLNECVKNVTGYPVSWHIQQRVILEAKRLLAYSNQSVKEISGQLGFDDYPYFSRLFQKNTGVSALSFRKKNRD